MSSDDLADVGLHEKYEVYKDGEPVEDCFVLEPEDDSVARKALQTYAEKTTNQQLRAEIEFWLMGLRDDNGQ